MNIFNSDYQEYIHNMDFKDLVFLDPPWSYNDSGLLRETQLNYNLWDNDLGLEFCFQNLNCSYIFMWVTNSMIYNVMNCDHFNYEYKTLVTWIKQTSKGNLMYGMGRYFRNCTEHICIFKKKKLKGSLNFSDRNILYAASSKRTQKPRSFETQILDKFISRDMDKFSYIFSGPDILEFESYNIDLVDIIL